ncbi:HEXXH motif-containing putative peptide modification protein [Streptomyces sp. SL13]|uniref:HEXXH motif-containing putative peptide modification protein n=1 Tax=Streptantibioticus silvisoli TaxID=2705255 RepID=A0AA90HAV6_9ACTN|nr:HEXXH motif-containing putative peptide modification protein [Streptantibioticus silvisoli]MDI5973973.1 HEXXH motif-containing putative peptide modification protein [Streptantibioticus silvisoli]
MDDKKAAFLEAGLDLLRSYEADLAAVFRLTVTAVFSSRTSETPGSMTSSAAIGAVWISPADSWTPQDLTEAYVHELTHTLVMLDEHRYGHYPHREELDNPVNLVPSAIRREKRTLFASAHSIFVAAELLRLRERHHGHGFDFRLHPASRALRDNALRALDSILTMPNRDRLVGPRLRELLDATGESMRSLRLGPTGS